MNLVVFRRIGLKGWRSALFVCTTVVLCVGCRTQAPSWVPEIGHEGPPPLLDPRGGAVPSPYGAPSSPASPAVSPASVSVPEDLTPSVTPPVVPPAEIEPVEMDVEAPEPEPEDIELPGDVESDLLIHTVEKGDSLWAIGRMYGITHQELAAYNGIDESEAIKLATGTVLRIPPGGRFIPQENRPPVKRPDSGSAAPSVSDESGDLPEGGKYIVKSGDSLWVIARRFGMKVSELRSANNLTTDVLQIGQVLVIPGVEDETSDEAAASSETPSETGMGDDTGRDDVAPETGVASPAGIPPSALSYPKTLEHTVSQDETLQILAEMYETDVESIKKANNGIDSDDDLVPNMRIVVPYH